MRHWVFPGNTVDVSTVSRVKAELRGWKLGRCLFVGDAGMVSRANLKTLSRGGGKYLLAMPMKRGDEVTEAVLARAGRYHKVADNLEVKEVVVGDGERRRRYTLCYNPRSPAARSATASSASPSSKPSWRVCRIRAKATASAPARCAPARYGRFLKVTRKGLAIDRQAVKALERFDGKFVVHSNDDTLTAQDMALGYKQQRVESVLVTHPFSASCWKPRHGGLSAACVTRNCQTRA